MSEDPVQSRAAIVAAMPHVQRWVRRFQRVAKDMPPEVWVFAGPCCVGCSVMANDESGRAIFEGEQVDQNSTVAHIDNGRFDGGDF